MVVVVLLYQAKRVVSLYWVPSFVIVRRGLTPAINCILRSTQYFSCILFFFSYRMYIYIYIFETIMFTHMREARRVAEPELTLEVTPADVNLAAYGQRCAVPPPRHDLCNILRCCDERKTKKEAGHERARRRCLTAVYVTLQSE